MPNMRKQRCLAFLLLVSTGWANTSWSREDADPRQRPFAKSFLSPTLQIPAVTALFRQTCGRGESTPRITYEQAIGEQELAISSLTERIMAEARRGNFALFHLPWHYYHAYYQEFIIHAAALNAAIAALSQETCSQALMQAMAEARVEMIEHYQAPLSETGRTKVAEVKRYINTASVTPSLVGRLRQPPVEWFIPLSSYSLPHTTEVRLIATHGCSS
ncbi:MAG: hypothetical protein NC924_09915 [Candidatus Omnitrophica bacterium]|nr:hypothetical protein [Candidatus Omnitrophota bacterium]